VQTSVAAIVDAGKYEALENAIHVAIKLLCDAIAAGRPDAQMIDRMGHALQAGIARLHAIDAAAKVEREVGAPLTLRTRHR
jgi:hypothetical protein